MILRYQGPAWLLFRLRHAMRLRTGWFEQRLPCRPWTLGTPPELEKVAGVLGQGSGSAAAVTAADQILSGAMTWYGRHSFESGFPPDWFRDMWGGAIRDSAQCHWSKIDDFSSGDIKNVWEQARFGFVGPLIRAHVWSGDERYVAAFWKAVHDWRAQNPPQSGTHWKCGQEIALRLIGWTTGLSAFRTHPLSTKQRQRELGEMFAQSAERIAVNIDYALSQKNNHAVSEAAGLLTCGVVLSNEAWTRRGHSLLQRLARELIYEDGSFSQHSLNYHRLMLEVYCWAIRLAESGGVPLPPETIRRIGRAGRWLASFVDSTTGRAPNLGANDGAHLFHLTDLGCLDYRPTIQAVGLITEQRRWLDPGPWDELAAWLGVEQRTLDSPVAFDSRTTVSDRDSSQESVDGSTILTSEGPAPAPVATAAPSTESDQLLEFPDGGYIVWRRGETLALLRCPRQFRHRPSQCDLLHFDFWHRGRNFLRDSGTYSYNCEEPWQSYFASAVAHNTIQFDGSDAMPRVSRFLYSEWPRMQVLRDGSQVAASFRDYKGRFHSRTVRPSDTGFSIFDEVDGRFSEAVLRWRLDPFSEWTLTGSDCRSETMLLEVKALPEGTPLSCRISEGWESLYYREKTPLPVLEVSVPSTCRQLVTRIQLIETGAVHSESVVGGDE